MAHLPTKRSTCRTLMDGQLDLPLLSLTSFSASDPCPLSSLRVSVVAWREATTTTDDCNTLTLYRHLQAIYPYAKAACRSETGAWSCTGKCSTVELRLTAS